MNDKKIIVILNIVVYVLTIVYIYSLCNYNELLYQIQLRSTNKIEQIYRILSEDNFYTYLMLGALSVVILVVIMVYDVKKCFVLGLINTIILCVISLLILIVLIKVYSNPIVTTFVCGVTGMGVAVVTLSKG